MDTNANTLHTLFDQLGLPSSESAVENFIAQHKPLNPDVYLAKASFWSVSQQAFLEESLEEDSVWAEVVDQLDALLRD
ncbi:MAG: DUF2789 domain-containing protein [Porticoccus sp.]|nr:DUF2789 domain-containing protein [Porticoccus sp.]